MKYQSDFFWEAIFVIIRGTAEFGFLSAAGDKRKKKKYFHYVFCPHSLPAAFSVLNFSHPLAHFFFYTFHLFVVYVY